MESRRVPSRLRRVAPRFGPRASTRSARIVAHPLSIPRRRYAFSVTVVVCSLFFDAVRGDVPPFFFLTPADAGSVHAHSLETREVGGSALPSIPHDPQEALSASDRSRALRDSSPRVAHRSSSLVGTAVAVCVYSHIVTVTVCFLFSCSCSCLYVFLVVISARYRRSFSSMILYPKVSAHGFDFYYIISIQRMLPQ